MEGALAWGGASAAGIAGNFAQATVGAGAAVLGGSKGCSATGPRTFSSGDPLVADLANKIERAYPGHVVGVNVPLRNAAGKLVTDADILLRNAVIQVKSGSGTGLTNQLLRTQQATQLPVIGYGPRLGGQLVQGIERTGGLVTRNEQFLIELISP